MNRRQFVLGLAAGSLALTGIAHAKAGRVEKLIVLQGSGKGKARYRVDPGNKRSLAVEVEKLKPLAGQTLTVVVISGANTITLGTIRVSALGAGKIERKTELGHTVPSIVPGDIVQVRNAGGEAIQSGTF